MVCGVSIVGGVTWQRCELVVSRLPKKDKNNIPMAPRRVSVLWALFFLLLVVELLTVVIIVGLRAQENKIYDNVRRIPSIQESAVVVRRKVEVMHLD